MKWRKRFLQFRVLLAWWCSFLSATTVVAQQAPAPMPGYTLPAPLAIPPQVKTSILLPSARYQLQIDPRQIAYELPALDARELQTTRPNQVGVSRQFPISAATHGTRVTTADGNTIVVLAVTSRGAGGLRVHFTNFDLGPEDYVSVRGGSAEGAIAGPYHGRGPWNDEDFWSSTIEGDTVVIEYLSRGGGRGFGMAEVSHLYATPDVLSCEVDASCGSTSDKNAVGRILFTEDDGNSYVCTGTLLSNRQQDSTPYFLTANHCISTQSVARTVETYWFYQTTGCNSGVLRNDIQTSSSGADLLATDASKDFAFLKLSDTPPAGVKFAGWDPNPVAIGTSVFALHHPGGRLPPSPESYLRRSVGTLANSNSSCPSTGLSNGYRVNWNSGTTEAGSSGAGIWYGQEGASYFVGVLSCGSVTGTCTGSYDFYAKFSDFYPAIKSYLDPPPVIPNDKFANAQLLSSESGTATGSNASATKEAGEPNHAGQLGGASVWYSWTAPSGGTVVMDTFQSNFDTLLAVYTGNNVAELSPVASNDDAGSGGRQSRVTFRAVAGTTYQIAVDGYGAATGNIVLHWGLAAAFGNISTRLIVGTGDNAVIGGFVITGTQLKTVVVRGIGPSLMAFGIQGALSDPVVEIYDSGGVLRGTNDNWNDAETRQQIIDSGLAPTNELESALWGTINPGAYTVVVRGKNDGIGVGLFEVYDVDQTADSKLANISTRGFVNTGDNVMIGGTIVVGSSPATVLIRAIGPSLTSFGVPNALQDPTIELHDGNGALIGSNDNWRSDQESDISATTIPPTDDRESAILRILSPGAYTAVVHGSGNSTGVALVEAYQLQ